MEFGISLTNGIDGSRSYLERQHRYSLTIGMGTEESYKVRRIKVLVLVIVIVVVRATIISIAT